MFRKILVANRGEIAVRILKACREMGIASAVVYSDADRHALHVRMADEAISIGESPPSQSYLSIHRILDAARTCQADAVHPGYGFLSENADFAQAVLDSGLAFIGPPPQSIRAMGDKAFARQRMQRAGVPVVPGYDGEGEDAFLAEKALEIGFPLLVKAASGGGGKGMRLVEAASGTAAALSAARREALHSFGDGRLILERYIPRARHIEIQVLADSSGNVLHLFERECSIQRRHQKIIEESPSPWISPDLRAKMGAAAVQAAQAVAYRNAGTVEFLVDPQQGSFYFLEMNTRLQVEHAVTELVTGLDLVQWQIRIAAGEELPFSQEELSQRGSSIECRLYAEDPANHFLPAVGPVLFFSAPSGPGIRCDFGYSTGDEITLHYDPMIAKIISYAEDRPGAVRRMAQALKDTILLGVDHNGEFLQDVLSTPEFQTGEFHTAWVEERFEGWQPPQCAVPDEVLIAAALTWNAAAPVPDNQALQPGRHTGPWQALSGYRTGEPQAPSLAGEIRR